MSETPEKKGVGGRPRDSNKLQFRSIGLRPARWSYLALWWPSDNITEQINNALERLEKYAPAGPDKFGHAPSDKPRKKPLPRSIRAYADQHGMTPEEVITLAWKQFESSQKGGD